MKHCAATDIQIRIHSAVPGPIAICRTILTSVRALLLHPAIAMILCCFTSITATAASPQGSVTDLATMSMEELMAIEVDTVTGASRYEQPISEAPASVTIVTADDIKMFGYRNLADILQSVPGFSVTNDRNYQYAGIRGFGLPGDYGTRMLLLVDGVRQNDPIYQTGFIGNEMVIDTDLIERVEIIRGPGHTLYGANAMLAVVNVVTQRGRDYDGIELSGEAGSFDSYRGRLSYGSRFWGTGELLVSGTFYHSRGQDLFYPEFAAPGTSFGWARGCDRERFGNGFLKLAYRDLTLEAGYVKRDKVIPTAPWGTVFNNPNTESTDSSLFVDLKYQHVFENGTDLMARFSWNQYLYDGSYLYDWAEPGDPPLLVANIDKDRSSWLMGEVQVVKELMSRHRLIGGVEFRDVLRMEQQNYDVEEVFLNDRRSAWNVGIYLQDEYQIFDNLILNAGIRYDYFDTFGSTVNPRVALIYSPLARTTLKLLFGTAFRPPSGYELYYGDGGTQKTNPGLREESSTNCEFILEQDLGKKFRGTVSGYYSWARDLIAQTTDPADGLLVFRNIAKAELRGIELALDKKWDNGIQGRFSYAFQDARDTSSGELLPNSAQHLAKLNVVLPLVAEKVFLGIEEQYTSRKRTLSNSIAGDYFVTNLTLFSRNLMENLELSGSVYNLFDTRYLVPAGSEHLQHTIEQDGRSFRIKMTYRF